MDLRGKFLLDSRLQLLQQLDIELEPLCAVLGWSFGRLHKYLHILLCALSYCNGIDSKALNRPLNPLWRMNTNSTELLVIVLHLWDRWSRDV